MRPNSFFRTGGWSFLWRRLSYRPAGLCSLAGRYDNQTPEPASSPRKGLRIRLQVAISSKLTLIEEEALRRASSFLSLLMEWVDHVDKLRAGECDALSPCILYIRSLLNVFAEIRCGTWRDTTSAFPACTLRFLSHLFILCVFSYFSLLQVDGRGIHILRFLHTFAPSIHPALGELWSKRLNSYPKGTVACDFN